MVEDYKNVSLNCDQVTFINDISDEEVFCTNVQDAIIDYVLPIILVPLQLNS